VRLAYEVKHAVDFVRVAGGCTAAVFDQQSSQIQAALLAELRSSVGGRLRLSKREIEQVACFIIREPRLNLLDCLIAADLVRAEVAAEVVVETWADCYVPRTWSEAWRRCFTFAGYAVDGVRSARPAAPLRLYRGATKPMMQGWSWTENRSVADEYALRSIGPRKNHGAITYQADVEPWRLFARITHQREYVIDPVGMEITAAT
jgi:hypothetical protein